MEGVVKAFVGEKGFGFIDGQDGQSYFFHKKDVLTKQAELKTGTLLQFDPVPTPKGLAAKKIIVLGQGATCLREPDRFLFITNPTPDKGRLLVASPHVFKAEDYSPDGARQKLRELTEKMGGNCVTQALYTRDKEYDGNYIQTLHVMSGVPSLVALERSALSVEDVKVNKSEWDKRIAEFDLVTAPPTPEPYVETVQETVDFGGCVGRFLLGVLFVAACILLLAYVGSALSG